MTKRYHTKSLAKAVHLVKQKGNNWRIAAKVSNRIVFDIDINSESDAYFVLNYYEKIFGALRIMKTYSGFHLISKKIYENKDKWRYDICRVLYPILNPSEVSEYIQKIHNWYKEQCIVQRTEQIQKKEFLEKLPARFAESGLDLHVGNFDILFAIKVIYNDYYCIRITKKSTDDKPYEVSINSMKIIRV